MADFQVVEPLSKKKSSGWMTNLITIAIIVFVVIFGLYFVANFYDNYIRNKLGIPLDIDIKIYDHKKKEYTLDQD